MSNIDIVKHIRVGSFVGLPIYLAREDGCYLGTTGYKEPANILKRHNLAIGGGSGEHPALVICEPRSCVLFALAYYFPKDRRMGKIQPFDPKKTFVYCDGATKKQWQSEFRREYCLEKEAFSFEEWIAYELGIFVYHMLCSFYPEVKKWHNEFGDIWVPYSSAINLPWQPYEGNGVDLFSIVQKKELGL